MTDGGTARGPDGDDPVASDPARDDHDHNGHDDNEHPEHHDHHDPSRYDPVDVLEGGDLDLRAGADACYKCTACDTSCPVAEVDDAFPGPKFQGPEQWRLKRKEDADVDPSVLSCSNCMRCDAACPSSVPLSQMHNAARGAYVDEQMDRLSLPYLRNRLLSNYRIVAELASRAPRIANVVAGLGVTRWAGERLLGITGERTFPAFATQTFREWWRERGGARIEDPDRRVAYFHGCYANYNTPEVGRAMVRVYEHFGYEVLVPEQRCSGTPMFANGFLDDARREAETNVEHLTAAIADGADVIASCTSCSLSLRQEYPELFAIDGIDDLAARTFEAVEYLRIHEDLEAELAEAELTDAELDQAEFAGVGRGGPDSEGDKRRDGDEAAFAYHAPCHARTQGLARQTPETFRDVAGVQVEDVGDSCSGISGTYGWKAEKYETSMAIGEEMFAHMEAASGNVGLTECPTCAMQMAHGTGYEVRHPLEVLEALLVDGRAE